MTKLVDNVALFDVHVLWRLRRKEASEAVAGPRPMPRPMTTTCRATQQPHPTARPHSSQVALLLLSSLNCNPFFPSSIVSRDSYDDGFASNPTHDFDPNIMHELRSLEAWPSISSDTRPTRTTKGG